MQRGPVLSDQVCRVQVGASSAHRVRNGRRQRTGAHGEVDAVVIGIDAAARLAGRSDDLVARGSGFVGGEEAAQSPVTVRPDSAIPCG